MTTSSSADRKTEASTNKQMYAAAVNSNVLNNYRSITYNFTLAALPSDYLSNPESYRKAELDLVILKSGGKGSKVVTNNVVGIQRVTGVNKTEIREGGRLLGTQTKNIYTTDFTGSALVDGFNKNSPGKFDMFIDDIDIDTIMTFDKQSTVTLPTQIKFEVIEPYSVNGFIEALHVTAVAAGYTSYISASFVLKLEFWGIPDTDTSEFKQPEKIKNADRYFPIGLTNVEVELSERGTKYVCSAVPYNEKAFGQPSLIKKAIQMKGTTVKTILENFIESFNDQIKQSLEDSRKNSSQYDEYFIKFVTWDGSEGWVENNNSDIAKSSILELFEDNALYNFANPNQGNNAYKPGTRPKSIKYNPSSTVINFPEKKNVHEVISAVIRDSMYIREILRDIDTNGRKSKYIDDFGKINYFLVRIETINKPEFDTVTKKPFQKFYFVVSPYKVHFTRIPTYGQVQLKEEEFKKSIVREYNYFYMGKNIDVTNFKLNFNTLFFEAIPVSLADQNTPNQRDSVKPSSRTVRQVTAPSKEEQSCNNPSHPMAPVREIVPDTQPIDGSGSDHQNDPYNTLARTMHDAIINSKASMITGEIDILGDPVFLVTGGMGNYNPKPKGNSFGEVGEGEVAMNSGEVNIAINFRNPIDIGDFESGGNMIFDPNRVPFSGVYMVTKVKNTFKDGVFKQRIEILRKPGQIIDSNCSEKDLNSFVTTVPDSNSRAVATPTVDFRPSQRIDAAEVSTYFNRGEPNLTSNHTGALGGVTDSSLPLSRVYGLVGKSGELKANSSVIGQVLPVDPTSNIRLNTSKLANLFNTTLSSAALLNSAANVITGNASLKSVAGNIAGSIIGASISDALNKSNIGSGIGEGASVLISAVDKNALLNPTANDIKFGALSDPLKIATDSITNVAGAVTQLGTNALSAVNRLGADAEQLVGDIKNKIDSSLGSVADPKALAARIGIDTAKLSGLSNNLESKLGKQIEDIKNLIPQNTNLSQSLKDGLALDTIAPSQLPNLPPTNTFAKAPEPSLNISRRPSIQVPSLNNVSKTINSVDSTVISDKLKTVKNQLGSFLNNPNIPDIKSAGSALTTFGSKTLTSPLNKLVNSLNDPNAATYTGDDPYIRSRLGLPPKD